MTNLIGRICWFLAGTAGVTACSFGGEAPPAKSTATETTYTLRYKFRPGETIRWAVIDRNATRTAIDKTVVSTESVTQSVKLWRVAAVAANGDATFEHSIESGDWWQHISGRDAIRYNSRTDTKAPPGFEEVAAAVGKTLSVFTVDARGEIVKRERKYDKAAPPGEAKFILLPVPAEPITVGHVWSVQQDEQVTLPGRVIRRIQILKKMTLESVEGGIATIRVASRILTPIDDPRIESQLLAWVFDGSMRFDLAAGRSVSQQIDIDRRIVGMSGKTSSLHFVSRFTERLLRPDEKPAAEDPGKSKP